MPSDDVILGAYYTHDKSGEKMRMISASVPELDNTVRMIEPDMFPSKGFMGGFARMWTGSWDDFKEEWTIIEGM